MDDGDGVAVTVLVGVGVLVLEAVPDGVDTAVALCDSATDDDTEGLAPGDSGAVGDADSEGDCEAVPETLGVGVLDDDEVAGAGWLEVGDAEIVDAGVWLAEGVALLVGVGDEVDVPVPLSEGKKDDETDALVASIESDAIGVAVIDGVSELDEEDVEGPVWLGVDVDETVEVGA